MAKKLSKRLSACLDALSSLSRIADIGTDHAYLPCYGVANGILASAIAIDVIDGPLAQARKTISDYGLTDKIEVRKGSGLEPLDADEVEGVCIAGMGGKLISQLIEEVLPVAQSMERLVFQPQGGEYSLRCALFRNQFTIINEQLVEEDGIIYTIITAKPGLVELASATELLFGPILMKNVNDELFVKKWHQEIAMLDKVLSNIPDGNERRLEFEQRKKTIKEVLAGVCNA